MNTSKKHSEEFQRAFASHLFRQHKSETCFKLNSSVSETTLDEFKKRGCKVSVEPETGHYVIESDVPFRNLVTKAEWKKDRNATWGGLGLLFFFPVCCYFSLRLAKSLDMGLGIGMIWFLACVFIGGAAIFPDIESKERKQGVVLGLALCA